MLHHLRIRNLALVEDLEMTFGPGLNVITGETGAGKSILVGAIALALGERALPGTAEKESAVVEAEVAGDHRGHTFKREVRPDGRTRAWIDDTPETITALREAAAQWVDLTAQREGASLLDPETHLKHIDRIAGLAERCEKLETMYHRWQALNAEIRAIEARISRMRETEELARFQLEEIERFDPQPGEDETLDREIRLLEGAESLLLGLGGAVEALDQEEGSIADRTADVLRELNELARIDESLAEQAEWVSNALELLREAARELASRRDCVELDPERLEQLRDRRGQLSRLVRKYGGSMESLLATRDELRQRESGGRELEEEHTSLLKKLQEHLASWEEELTVISRRRRNAVPEMEQRMREALKSVGIKHPEFSVAELEEAGEKVKFPSGEVHRVGPRGWDRFEFRVSFNPGRPLKPLQNVASGGELSRVMLLLKGLSPPDRSTPTLIFDEIDTGISGRTARRVGLRLKSLAEHRQVILVTHLPQIASLADRHLVVEKIQQDGRTVVRVNPIPTGGAEQVEEIARLVGGEHITDAARATAGDLINNR